MATGGGGGGSGGSGDDDINDYFSEIDDIQMGKGDSGTSQSDDELSKTPDEGEQEMSWLTEAGYPHYVSTHEAGKVIPDEDVKVETSSLTRHQAAAVKKRVDTLNATIRKKHHVHKPPARGDVRDVFAPVESEGGGSSGSPGSGSSPSKAGHRGGMVINANSSTSSSSSPSSQQQTRHHSEPAYAFTTDIPAQNPNSTGGGAAGAAGGGNGNGGGKRSTSTSTSRHHGGGGVTSKGSVLKHREKKYYMHEGGHRSAEETGILTTGISMKEQNGGDRDQYKDIRRPKVQKEQPLSLERQGVTRMEDLGIKDRIKIRSLALMELTAMFDERNITYTRRKRKKKLKDNGLFGVPLQSLLDHDRKRCPDLKVPSIFTELVLFLEKTCLDEEGILRVPGSVSRIKELRGELEEGFENKTFKWEDVRPNDAAGLLKQFLRELPVPLLTLDYLEAFAQVEKIPKKEDQVTALNLLSLLLPDVHLATLLMLLSFLKKVVDCQENKMNISNVAMIIAPNLFLVASKSRSKTVSAIDIHMAAGTANIVRMLIAQQSILNKVPAFMVEQLRHQYETEQARKSREKSSIIKFLHKKDKNASRGPAILNEADFNKRIVQVHIPGQQGTTPVQLEATMNVAQLLDRCYQLGRSGDSTTNGANKASHLYEVGGNIGERRLDPEAHMDTLYRRNPNAEWTIK